MCSLRAPARGGTELTPLPFPPLLLSSPAPSRRGALRGFKRQHPSLFIYLYTPSFLFFFFFKSSLFLPVCQLPIQCSARLEHLRKYERKQPGGLALKVFHGQWKKMRKKRVWLPLRGSGPADGHSLVEMWSFIVTKHRLLSVYQPGCGLRVRSVKFTAEELHFNSEKALPHLNRHSKRLQDESSQIEVFDHIVCRTPRRFFGNLGTK
ncbi:uncharacterized protein LOC141944856 isoform X1 [Strix uralensis]|uniref:uncharacterized protein LOC141944856 isoform X1 n=1 Tax=Strix uralensis TaxID=36305 RepID=UPI003DA79675